MYRFVTCGFLSSLLFIGGFQSTDAQKTGAGWLNAKPMPQWIWSQKPATNGQKLFFQKSFDLSNTPISAEIYTTCDNKMKLWINGTEVGSSSEWGQPLRQSITKKQDLSKFFKLGTNIVSAACQNEGGVAAFVFKMTLEQSDKTSTTVVSDTTWKATSKEVEGWQTTELGDSDHAIKLAKKGNLGIGPWGIPGGGSSASSSDSAPLAAKEITVPAGFEVELLYSVPKNTEGSWVSITKGPGESLIVSDQGNKGLFEVTVGKDVSVKKIPAKVSGAQGLLWHNETLYANRNGGNLYRISDSDGDHTLDFAEVLPSANGGGEHGNHAVVLSEDEKSLYVVAGNHTNLPELASSRVPTWDEDLLLPRQWDARGHARGKLAPGGWVTKFNPETKTHDLYCIGFRNEYDVALNAAGDLFTFDADMEWDMGMPWYRPTRICQVVSGGDYGWRSGTGKWPTYYEDSLPPVVEIGPGSPTGVASGIGAKFPAKYQHAIFALDWTFGTIYAIHLEPNGAGYIGKSEPFCYGAPLPVTDATIGHDGALYFTVGGRGTQSGLYRVRYTGSESTAPATAAVPAEVTQARKLRRDLEMLHGKDAAKDLDFAWQHIGSEDRFIRHAARIALEFHPVETWTKRLASENDPQTMITASVALARVGKKEHGPLLAESLLKIDPQVLSTKQFLGLLRAYALRSIRLGAPDKEERRRTISRLRPHFPSTNGDINTELIRVLVSLQDRSIISDAMALITEERATEIPQWSSLLTRNKRYGGTIQKMIENHPPSRQINFALMLRNLRNGWTIDQRRQYFQFLNKVAKFYGGASYAGFLTNIREEALANCTNKERAALADITGENFNPVPDFKITPPQGPGRKWTVDSASKVASRGSFPKANFESGRNLFFATNCGKCHRYAGLGGGVGPDLTSIRNKFDSKYVIESIVDPSKVISDQYASSVVILENGKTLSGLVVEQDDTITVYPPDLKIDPITVKRTEVLEVAESQSSQMPKGLIDSLNEQELKDLIAYLMSGGDPKSKVYGKR